MAAFANKNLASALAPLSQMRTGSSVTVKREPFSGPRVARAEAAALNGPNGMGLATGYKHPAPVVTVRRAGKSVAVVDLSKVTALKLGK